MWSNLFANLTVVGSIHAIPPTATGITPGSNVFVFSNAAGRSMLMNSSGKIGIGTTTPTSELDVTGNVSVSNTVFIGNTFWTGANSTINVVGPPTRLVFDNTTTPYAANKILLHSNTASGNICGFGVTGLYNIAPMTLSYYTSGGHSFSIGANQNFGGYEVFSINETGQFNFGGAAQQAKLILGGSLGVPSTNTMMRIDSSNVALVTNGAGRVGFGTTAPTANLHVIGNVYASNALTTANLFTTTANVGTLNVWQVSNLSTLSLTNNLYAANAVTTTNLFSTTANVGTLNVWQVSNLSSLELTNNLYAANAVTTTNIYAAGFTSNASNTNFFFDTMTIPFVYSTTLNVASTSNLQTVTLTGSTGATTMNATGNLYVSNAITTTNVFATTANVGTLNVWQVSNLVTLSLTNNLYAANAVTTTNLFATGNTSSISNMVIQSFDFVVAATAGSYSNVCSIIDVPNGSAIYAIYVDMMARGAGGSAQTKTYIIVSNYNATAGVWTRALPIGNPAAGGQTGLDVMTLNGTTYLRATNRNAAETINVGMVVKVSSSSFSRVAITDLTSQANQTGTGATSTGFYPTTLVTQVANRVGVSIEVPTANLHVVGNQIVAGLTGTTSLNVTGNVYVSNAVTVTALYGNVVASNVVVTPATGVTGINVTGNIYASNAVTTTNVFAATVSTTNPVSFRNRVINGDFFIDQRNAGAATTPTVDGTRVIDRWKANIVSSGSGRCQVGQNLGAFAYPVGFTSYYGMKVTTTSTPGAADYFFLSQIIEGINMVDWLWGTANAKTVTLSFWVQSSLTGTAGGFVRNAGTTGGNYSRSYPFTFTINNTLTWEYKTVTIPGDTTGQWLTNQTDGVEFGFDIWNGSTYQASPGAWAAGNYTGPSGGTINYAGNLNSNMNISGVQIEMGPVATPYERRHIDVELGMCQRYYETTIARLGGYNLTGGGLRSSVYFNTKKRPAASPTFTVISAVETPINMGTVNIDNSNFDGSSARIIASITTTGEGYGQWKVSVDCEF